MSMPSAPGRNWFSNFLPYDEPLVVDGTRYATPEHFYQAMKTDDPVRHALIASAKTASKAKALAADRAQTRLRPGWNDEVSYAVMTFAQEHRYRPCTAMREKLRTTIDEIVEWNNWHDQRWGKCTCPRHNNQGTNWLGQILMELRDRIWQEDGLPEGIDSFGRKLGIDGRTHGMPDGAFEVDIEPASDTSVLADLGLAGLDIDDVEAPPPVPFVPILSAATVNVQGLAKAALAKIETSPARVSKLGVHRKLIGFDTETHLVQPGRAAPKMVCGQFVSEDGTADIFLRDDALFLLHHFLDQGFTLVGQNIAYDVAVTCAADPTLLPKWIKAYDEDRVDDTMIREKMIALAKGQLADEGDTGAKRGQKYDLATIVRQRFNVNISKDKAKTVTMPDGTLIVKGLQPGQAIPWRLRYKELDGIPIDQWPSEAREYALDDSKWVLAVWAHQQLECGEPIPDLYSQVRSACWMKFMGVWGIRTDPAAVLALHERIGAEYEHSNVMMRESGLLKSKIVKGVLDWSKDTKKLKGLVELAYAGRAGGAPKTEGGTKHRKKCVPVACVTCDGDGVDGFGVTCTTCNGRGVTGCVPTCIYAVPAISTDRDTLVNAPKHHLPECTPLKFIKNGDTQTRVGGCRAGCLTGILTAVGERSGTEKILTTFIPVLMQGTKFPINPAWNELVASGRSSCRGENLQQPPRKGGVRECFVPRFGNYFVAADYSFIELCTLAQACIDFFGFSKLADAINAGLDPHLDMAVFMLAAIDAETITYAEAVRRYDAGDARMAELRQFSKVSNFGLPGGLGAETLVEYARTTFGVTITLEVAKTLKPLWLAKWPEMVQYLRRISNLTQHGRTFAVQQLRSLRIRGDCAYTAAANSYFQGMAADGAKEAGWRIFKETVLEDPCGDGSGPTALYGSHLTLFLHDEFIIESAKDRAPAAALRLAQVMIEGMKMFVPDVNIKAEPVITDRWRKGAKPSYGPDGMPVLWMPKK